VPQRRHRRADRAPREDAEDGDDLQPQRPRLVAARRGVVGAVALRRDENGQQ
jgi:hypothetical protein